MIIQGDISLLQFLGTSTIARVSLLMIVFSCQLMAQRDFSKVEVTATRMTDHVFMLGGAGGNLGLSSGDNGIFLIDDQFAPLTEKITGVIATATGSKAPVRFLLNTHWHGDHTGGNENLANAGAVIVAHENVRRRMSVQQINEFFKDTTQPSPGAALPIVTFTRDVTFHLNDDEIHVFHVMPAHTDGDAVVHFTKSNIIHAGDLFFSGMYPFIDLASGGSVDGMIAAADTMISIANDQTKFIPGHGPISTLADLRMYREMLSRIRDQVRSMVEAGRTLDQVKAAKPTAEFDEKWGKGFMKPDSFLEIVYSSLSRR